MPVRFKGVALLGAAWALAAPTGCRHAALPAGEPLPPVSAVGLNLFEPPRREPVAVVEFSPGQAALAEADRAALRQRVFALPPGARLHVAGFSQGEGGGELARSLSAARALEVRRLLLSAGAAAASVQAVGYGEDLTPPEGSGRNALVFVLNSPRSEEP